MRDNPKYSTSELWQDVSPIPLQEPDSPAPTLAAIAYSPAYSEAMSYLRAVMAANEFSERTLDLTADVIGMNPAHYTVWLYRVRILEELGTKDEDQGSGRREKETEWLNNVAFKHLKNYQIWHHRQTLMSHSTTVPASERPFLTEMLAMDSKNYHVWSYRQWLVEHFSLWDDPEEWACVERMIEADVRNNSAWNHRWFLCFGQHAEEEAKEHGVKVVDEDIVDREVGFAMDKIVLAPANESPWNYLRGVMARGEREKGELSEWVRGFAGQAEEGRVDGVRSVQAIEWLVECEEEELEIGKAKQLLRILEKLDPIRKGYWGYRARLFEEEWGQE